jgi:hypothetical protein
MSAASSAAGIHAAIRWLIPPSSARTATLASRLPSSRSIPRGALPVGIGEPVRAGQRAGAADHDQAVDPPDGERRARPVADLAVVELLAARRAEDRAALAQDAGDVGRRKGDERPIEQAAIAALDADDVDALRPRDQGRRADRRVHPRSVPAAGQDPDALDCHVQTPLRNAGCPTCDPNSSQAFSVADPAMRRPNSDTLPGPWFVPSARVPSPPSSSIAPR